MTSAGGGCGWIAAAPGITALLSLRSSSIRPWELIRPRDTGAEDPPCIACSASPSSASTGSSSSRTSCSASRSAASTRSRASASSSSTGRRASSTLPSAPSAARGRSSPGGWASTRALLTGSQYVVAIAFGGIVTLLYGLVFGPAFARRDPLVKMMGTLGLSLILLGLMAWRSPVDASTVRILTLKSSSWTFTVAGRRRDVDADHRDRRSRS